MKIAGYWRRFFASWIDTFLAVITVGVMFVIQIIQFCSGKPTFGMKVTGITYSYGSGRMLRLFLFKLLWTCLLLSFIIDFFTIIMKKGTFPEIWADNYIVVGLN
ncbi:hypothetical protein [Mycoplasma sp. 480]|uniref:hypothetical protein n=1 Tax=Mycoplasma sp. 480 TaxID=3440155 RepID=UPI003F513551